MLVNGELKTRQERLDGTLLNHGGTITIRWVDKYGKPMPYFVYEFQVKRVPLNGEVVVLSDGIIIRGGNDVEYPEYYSSSGTYIDIAEVTFYTTDNQQVGSTRKIGRIICANDKQNEYYPPKE